jgi:DNA-binding IclR family transcriptional regulator
MVENDTANQKMKRRPAKSVLTEPACQSRSLAKGLQLLEILASAAEPMTLADLAISVGLGKASTLRLLRTLHGTGYLLRDQNGNYHSDRDRSFPKQNRLLRLLRESARPVLARLNAEFGETVALAFLFDDLIRVVDVIESTHDIRMSNYKGRILQAYASSLGKSITAFQTTENTRKLLHAYGIFRLTPATLTDFRAIQEHLAEVRERGYAWDREETVPGGACVGAPIRMPGGEVLAALSMSMPKGRFTEELQRLLPARMKQAGEKVTEAMRRAEKAREEPARSSARRLASL